MIIIYDMNTGQVHEPSQRKSAFINSFVSTDRLQPNLQEVLPSCHSREERRIPPELAIADLNAFLEQMG
jgi:hypothetical protein